MHRSPRGLALARWAAIGALGAATAACGPDGRAAYAGWTLYESDAGGYRIRYLEPPWIFVREEGARAHFKIESTAEAAGFRDSGVPSKYTLELNVEAGTPMARAMADQRGAASRRESVITPTRPFETAAGVEGSEVITQSIADPLRPRFKRYTYVRHPRGVLRMLVEAYADIDDVEVGRLLGSAEIVAP